MSLPTRMKDIQRFMETLDLREIEAQVAAEARAQIAIIGPVNSGKSTLFNQLKGKKLSTVSAVPGTTTEALSERFGPFWLVDTPGFGEVAGTDRATLALQALDQADVAVLVLDAAAGVRQSDADLFAQVRAHGVPVVVVLNKIDLLKGDLKPVLRDAELKLRTPIIPISAKYGTGVAQELIPALIDAHPRMAVTIGRALPRYRRQAARRIIRESGGLAAVVGAEPVPGLSIPVLIAIQVRLLLRLAAIYGETMSAARARELIGAIAGGLAIRYGAQELAKLVPGAGWLAAGFAAATGTVALGNAAIVFFENVGKIHPADLREVYKRFRWRRREAEAELLEEHENS
ncbi:MAG: hypothetical protein Kow00124_20380 [Anaerolineae bacterium]